MISEAPQTRERGVNIHLTHEQLRILIEALDDRIIRMSGNDLDDEAEAELKKKLEAISHE